MDLLKFYSERQLRRHRTNALVIDFTSRDGRRRERMCQPEEAEDATRPYKWACEREVED